MSEFAMVWVVCKQQYFNGYALLSGCPKFRVQSTHFRFRRMGDRYHLDFMTALAPLLAR
jgi:hypothetical protein